MLSSNRRPLAWLVALLASIGLIAAACGSDSNASANGGSGNAGTSGANTSELESLSGTLNGSGASFPSAFYEEAIGAFEDVAPGLTVLYDAVGSGTGKQNLADEVNDWAGSDSLVSERDQGDFNRPFLYIPTVSAPITVSYNLDGVDELNLSAETIAGIFMGEITAWDAPEIAADNPDADLPSTEITVATRSDGSGTTNNFTKYLKAAAPSVFTLDSGDTVAWPRSTTGNGNSGVAQIISSTQGAIGYVDLSDANATGLSYAAVKNKSGEFVEPTLEATSAALDGAEIEDDLTYDPLDADGAEAYPITAPTYVLVYETYSDQAMVDNLKGWLNYLLGDAQDLAEDVDFARLPDSLQERALAQVAKIRVG